MIDIWQSTMISNNIPELVRKYSGQISFMDGVKVDFEGWTPEVVAQEAGRASCECGKLYFIPCGSQGELGNPFPDVYEELLEMQTTLRMFCPLRFL